MPFSFVGQVFGSYLPHRQLRNCCMKWYMQQDSYLPHRQLRKKEQKHCHLNQCYLPHRQLRNS